MVPVVRRAVCAALHRWVFRVERHASTVLLYGGLTGAKVVCDQRMQLRRICYGALTMCTDSGLV
jgi:hypothetical protein